MQHELNVSDYKIELKSVYLTWQHFKDNITFMARY